MDSRASLPVSLPYPNPTMTYWQDPPDPEIADFRTSEKVPEEVIDTVIIGSGITGATIAWRLLQIVHREQKEGRIVMLEARQACSGATGRNGGHRKAASYRSFPSNSQALGKQEALKIARLEYKNIVCVHQFAKSNGIECESRSCNTVDIIYDQKQWDECVSAVRLMGECFEEGAAEARYQLWTAAEAREKFLVKGTGTEGEEIFGAVSYEAGSISAYKFVIGLLKKCLDKGLELFNNTPATKIEKSPDDLWTIQTSRGFIKAKRVVLATNGYTAALLPQFQGSIVPLRGQVTAHRPGNSMPSSGLETTYSFIYNNGYEYMIPRPTSTTTPFAYDIIIGGGLVKAPEEGLFEYGNTDDSSLNQEISAYLQKTTKTYFGSAWGSDHEEGRIRKGWTGIMGYSPDGFPFIGEVPGDENKGLWICASFQGHGMVLCFTCAQALVAMMEGTDWEALDESFPEVFKVSKGRMEKRFAGRLHTVPMDVETEKSVVAS